MKKVLTHIIFVFLRCFAIGCQQGEKVSQKSKADVEADIQAIKDIVIEFNNAVSGAADIGKVMSLYADDAVWIPPNKPAAIGKEAIQRDEQQLHEEISA